MHESGQGMDPAKATLGEHPIPLTPSAMAEMHAPIFVPTTEEFWKSRQLEHFAAYGFGWQVWDVDETGKVTGLRMELMRDKIDARRK